MPLVCERLALVPFAGGDRRHQEIHDDLRIRSYANSPISWVFRNEGMYIRTASWLPSMLTCKAQYILSPVLLFDRAILFMSPLTVANYRLDGTAMRCTGEI